MRNKKAKIQIPTILKYVALCIWAVIDIYPLFWVVMSSLKDKISVIARPLALPTTLRFQSYVEAWIDGNIGQNFMNTVLYSACSVVLIALFSSMAAFALTRIIRSKLISGYFTLGIMIPAHGILIPCFIIMKYLHFYNNRLGFIILMVAANLSLSIFVLTSFMKSIPMELDEAAIIDGCSYKWLYLQIILPLAKPGIATICTLALLNCWNEYLYAYIMLQKESLRVITQGIFALQGRYATNYSALCAGLVISILPMMLFFVLFQEQVIGGMTAGSVKG